VVFQWTRLFLSVNKSKQKFRQKGFLKITLTMLCWRLTFVSPSHWQRPIATPLTSKMIVPRKDALRSPNDCFSWPLKTESLRLNRPIGHWPLYDYVITLGQQTEQKLEHRRFLSDTVHSFTYFAAMKSEWNGAVKHALKVAFVGQKSYHHLWTPCVHRKKYQICGAKPTPKKQLFAELVPDILQFFIPQFVLRHVWRWAE